jgi:hypothetical protein
MDGWVRNIRYAVRVLARTPGFTLTVVATLAIVIGANTAVFSLIDAVLLKPLPFPEPDRLVLLSESRDGAPIGNMAPVRLEEWNEASATLEAITGYYSEDASETSGDLPEKFRLARVAPRFNDVWGVAPALGRGFTPADSQEGAAPVALVSHRYWVDYLDGDPDVLQRQVRLTDGPYSIVGVMPADYRFPDRDVDIWVPRTFLPVAHDGPHVVRGGRVVAGNARRLRHVELFREPSAARGWASPRPRRAAAANRCGVSRGGAPGGRCGVYCRCGGDLGGLGVPHGNAVRRLARRSAFAWRGHRARRDSWYRRSIGAGVARSACRSNERAAGGIDKESLGRRERERLAFEKTSAEG